MIRTHALAISLALAAAVSSCGHDHRTYADYGAQLARDTTIAQNRYNNFTCLTCHAEHTSDVGTRIYPGAVLEGSAARPSWWGGNVLDLQRAVEDCYMHFMGGPRLDPTGDTAQALDAYLMDLTSHAPASTTQAVAFTVPPSISDIAPGDATRGADLYSRACQNCHGEKHTGTGHINPASILPDDTFTAHLQQYGPACTREIFIEKIRHGSFLGYAGVMPPFSLEVLSDQQVADILAYLEVPSGGVCMP
jgi:thiosulfate dehydrogenase